MFKSYVLRSTLLFAMLLFGTVNLSAIECPPDEDGENCQPWVTAVYTTTTDTPDCTLQITYRYQVCDDKYQIYIEDIQYTGNCNYLAGFTNSDSFQDWVDLVLIEEIANLENLPIVVNCTESSTKVIFYTASCGIWVKCNYKVDPESRVCDADWRGSYPDEATGEVSAWKYQSCGEACCKKTFLVCKLFDEENGWELHIQGLSKQKYGECSNPDGFVSPCQDGCAR